MPQPQALVEIALEPDATPAGLGAQFERELAQLLTVRAGVVAREQEFLSWDKGLRAAGLDRGTIALPAR